MYDEVLMQVVRESLLEQGIDEDSAEIQIAELKEEGFFNVDGWCW